jgi:hypothetical protein
MRIEIANRFVAAEDWNCDVATTHVSTSGHP